MREQSRWTSVLSKNAALGMIATAIGIALILTGHFLFGFVVIAVRAAVWGVVLFRARHVV